MEVDISLIERSLDVFCLLIMELFTPGPSHLKSGVPVTLLGREMEQERVKLSPATTGEEGEEVRERVAASVLAHL